MLSLLNFTMKGYVLTGFIGPAIAIIGIVIAIVLNSNWWSIENNAISDMGRPGLKYWYVLDISLLGAGIVLFHSVWFVKDHMHNDIEKYAIYFFLISAILLSLIGVFPEGTGIHWIISVSFFILGSLSLLGVGIGMAINGEYGGLWIVLIIALQYIFAIVTYLTFCGLAIPELISAIGIIISYYLILYIKVINR